MIHWNRFTSVCLTAILLGCLAATRPPSDTTSSASRLVLGSFDSRALAIAYASSEQFEADLGDKREQLEQAQAAGDTARVAALNAEGEALQQRLHRQGFGSAPVDDILQHLSDALPGIAQQAGVDVIVSKWDLVYQAPGITTVDVTDLLVAPFHPDARTLRWIEQMAGVQPLPEDELEHD